MGRTRNAVGGGMLLPGTRVCIDFGLPVQTSHRFEPGMTFRSCNRRIVVVRMQKLFEGREVRQASSEARLSTKRKPVGARDFGDKLLIKPRDAPL